MSATTRRWRDLAVGFLILAILAGFLPPRGHGQVPGKPTPYIASANDCARCHKNTDNIYKDVDVICRMTESFLWEEHDKHRLAFAALTSKRADEMGKHLGQDVKTWQACLACHGVFDRRFEEPKPGATAGRLSPLFKDKAQEGVTCVACHGRHQEWVGEHAFQKPDWRALTRTEKEQRFGMIDMWDPVVRLTRCASCHIGNVAEGKVVTHPMYAAGHPPLPGLEAATFSQAMPYHWEYLREKLDRLKGKKPEVQKALAVQFPDLDKLEQAELVAVSGLVALRETLALFIAEAERAEHDSTLIWPDFARFDCYACHHDVARASWRQARPSAAAPGRPPMPDWPTALVELGVEAAGPEKAQARMAAYQGHRRSLQAAVGARPFGDRARMLPAARSLKAWTDAALLDLRSAKFDRTLALKLLRRACRVAGDRGAPPDFDAARQLFWAFQAIYREIEPHAAKDAPIATILAALDARDHFSLPDASEQVPIESSLKDRAKAVVDFDPVWFQEAFGHLSEHVTGLK